MGDVPQEARVPTAIPAIQVQGTAGNLLQIIGMYLSNSAKFGN